MIPPRPLIVQYIVVAPAGWRVIDRRMIIKEGDWFAGVLSMWQPCLESVGQRMNSTGHKAVIRKII